MTINWQDYEQVTSYLYSLKGRYKKQGLKNIKILLDLMENPQKNLKVIHVGGTKGKGSVAVMISSILQSAGFKVGISTSPHLIDYTERITINNKQISKLEILKKINEIRPHLEKMIKSGLEPSFFEITIAISLKYFSEKNVDFAVIEVGVGGRFDATNVVEPLIAVITNSSLDHEHVLGNSVKQIAEEENAIIKKGCIAVTASEDNEVIKIYKNRCEKIGVPLYVVGNEIKYERLSYDLNGQTFNVNGILNDYTNLYISLLGIYQIVNATTAIAAIEALIQKGEDISKESIKNGLEKAKWRGRLEIIKRSPLLILDGAHNVDSVKKLKNAIKEIISFGSSSTGKIIFVIGIFEDKDIPTIIKILATFGEIIIATRAKTERSAKPEKIANEAIKYCENVIIKEDVKEAVELALNLANKNDTVCVTGSLYVVAEAMKIQY